MIQTYWAALFPGVDVDLELEKANEWLRLHKGRRGTERFYFNWLKRSHNNLLAAEVTALVRREQDRVDSAVGKLRE